LLSEIMGGDVSVTSQPGKGSTFKASLMLASINTPHKDLFLAPVQTIYGYKGATKRILLVDDEISHRQLMRAMLTPLGFDITDLDNPLLVLEKLVQEIEQHTCPA